MGQQLSANREELIALRTAYEIDMRWIREALDKQGTLLERVCEQVNKVDRTVHNGLSTRVKDIQERLILVEGCADRSISRSEVEQHFDRRRGDWHRNAALVVSIVAALTALLSVGMAIWVAAGKPVP